MTSKISTKDIPLQQTISVPGLGKWKVTPTSVKLKKGHKNTKEVLRSAKPVFNAPDIHGSAEL